MQSEHPPISTEPYVNRIQTKIAGYLETACCHHAATKLSQRVIKTSCSLSTVLLPASLYGTANFCARCSRHGKGSGCQLCQESGAYQQTPSCLYLVMRRSSNGAKNTRFTHPHAHICRHAPENPQNRADVYHYAVHSRLPSHQLPPTAAYAPDWQTSPTIFEISFQTVWTMVRFSTGFGREFYARILFWAPRENQK